MITITNVRRISLNLGKVIDQLSVPEDLDTGAML